MILDVICKEDFFVPFFNNRKYFIKGTKYSYKIDNLESLCDEQIFHVIDDFPITYDLFINKFSLLEDWRDQQIKNII